MIEQAIHRVLNWLSLYKVYYINNYGVFNAVAPHMLVLKTKKLKILVSIIVFNLLMTYRAVSRTSTLKKRGYIVYFTTGTLYKMALKELWKARIIFFMNDKYYYNAFKCYSDHYLMWTLILKKKDHVLVLMWVKGIHSEIGEEPVAILGDLHLILVHYRLHYPHA